jgi:hypothetical protein
MGQTAISVKLVNPRLRNQFGSAQQEPVLFILGRCQVGSLARRLNMQTWKSLIIVPGAETGGWFPRFAPLSSASRRASTLQKRTGLALTLAPLNKALTEVTDEDAHLYIPHLPS